MQQAIAQPKGSPAAGGLAGRRVVWVRWASIAAVLVGLLLVMSVLPVKEASQRLEFWITSLGVWGPVAFVAVYVVATVLMIPGSALTLAAGAIFGLGVGTAAASVASTTGAAAAFLIARYLARDRITRRFGKHPKFSAIDRAVAEGGWKIIVLLRLSPVLPFNVQNYLYGLTAVRFWPATLASWAGMLPGTFMYVYLGYAGRATAIAATDAAKSTGWGQTALTIVGLAATVAVTVYVTRLATRAIKQHTQQAKKSEPSQELEVSTHDQISGVPGRTWGVVIIVIVGVLALTGGAYARMNPQVIRGYLLALVGPPTVTAVESEPASDAASSSRPTATFDHAALDELLHEHVDANGWVDYEALKKDTSALDGYIAALAQAPFDDLGRDEKLALLINAYNAFTLRLILDHYPVHSILDIPEQQRWDAVRWRIAGGTYSLSQIEHELIRKHFAEPRIHFALVCAAYSCPPLRNEAYVGEHLEAQLHDQTVYIHTHDRWFVFDPGDNTVHLSSLYEWYGNDFLVKADSVPDYAAQYVPDLRSAMDAGRIPEVAWIDYDWKLNSKANQPEGD